MNEAELAMHDTLTRAFILADPTEVELFRATRTSDGAGGWVQGNPDDPINAQTFRLVPQSDEVPELVTSDGTRAKPKFIIVGPSDCDMQRYDQFFWNDAWWEIAQIHTKPVYEVKGDVVPRGSR